MNIDEMKQKYGMSNMKTNFINWDAIDQLPENYEPRFTVIEFNYANLKESFNNVGSKAKPSWYPKTELMYKIADAIGAEGLPESKVKWVTQEVNVNPLLLKSMIMDDATMKKIVVSARATKMSKILKEDGTWRMSPAETNEFNFFDRACLEFNSEELETENYTKHTKWPDGKQKEFNYDNPLKRERRYLELKKFALQQAETKAFLKTVRVLAGLPTGFTTEDLKTGKLIFSKFIKSQRLQKLETAARLEAMRNGKTEQIEDMSSQLFGTNQIDAPITEPYEPDTTEPEPENKSPFEKPVDEKEKIKIIIQKYISKDKENKNYQILKDTVGALEYLEKMMKEYDSVKLEKAKDTLLGIENHIPGIIKIDHDIDLGKDVF